jgi:hypothetical protein
VPAGQGDADKAYTMVGMNSRRDCKLVTGSQTALR